MAIPGDDAANAPPAGRGRPRLRVAIIGAGAGGLCMGVALRREGSCDFTIFEKSDGIGGTWWDNRFPGAEVDTAVPFYSFSFHPYAFTRTHVRQPELQAYLENVADTYGLRPHIRLRTAVVRAEWDEATHTYEVLTSTGERERFHVVVSAVGLLNEPNHPTWPGLDRFRGPKFHSARWDPDVDVTGKRVAVVGTGSTAAQIVPAIAPIVEHLTLFQRQPGWVMPKLDRDFTPEERARLLRPGYRRWMRLKQFLTYEKTLGKSFIEGTPSNVAAQRICEKFIEETFRDRPDLAKLVTPDYPFGGKRPVKESKFYPALLRENVELVPHAVAEVTETAVVDDTGTSHEVDVLVMCTGFKAASFLDTVEIVGRGGRTIHEVWGDEPHAYLGLTVAGFPNFYMLYGPNTNGAPIMFMHERQVEFVMANIKRMVRRGVTAIEVRKPVMDLFNRIIQRRMQRYVVARYRDVHNYGRARTGRDVIYWAEGMVAYAVLTRTTARLSSRAERLGSCRGAGGIDDARSAGSARREQHSRSGVSDPDQLTRM
ncbi:Predicted flavoprotein CzcO associated with the cation diffusion facilitator CzcD [Pseudonocardia thermophila]|jgi:Predicted flavoprotein involved in K+ transport|uniref:Predicted flavoprotein CzcO associated with the cation diffusion facilitator CzcD n=1 Tax=Pseudonocardia thermophila TaxID=1848 RepID=A0A1M6XPH7_PSETH|nr:NAD(P)/FAD-dependent oxidoreductase [Pseudonocardia thermophila]SHL07803.1 Predicted flavoprotein CzcO associated with the cation diffusion facilitator CzcD [Pseudonocardia thermophila]